MINVYFHSEILDLIMFWSNGWQRLGKERCRWEQERDYICQSYPQIALPFLRSIGPNLEAFY